MLARVSASAVAKIKAAAVVVATVGAGSVGGVVALNHVAPVGHQSSHAQHLRNAPAPSATTVPSAPAVTGHDATPTTHARPAHPDHRSQPSHPSRPVTPRSVASPPRGGQQHQAPDRAVAPTAPAPKTRPSHPHPDNHAPASPPAATPTAAPEPSCADNHGAEVSQTAQDTDSGKGHGEPVKTTAHSDCGKS